MLERTVPLNSQHVPAYYINNIVVHKVPAGCKNRLRLALKDH